MKHMIFAVLALAGCSATSNSTSKGTDPQEVASYGPPPVDYRPKVQAHIRKTFFDPYSIRDAAIAPPILAPGWLITDLGKAWTVCVMANAKNRRGAYTGRSPTIFRFKNGEVIDSTNEGGGQYYCEGQPYVPFPDIEMTP